MLFAILCAIGIGATIGIASKRKKRAAERAAKRAEEERLRKEAERAERARLRAIAESTFDRYAAEIESFSKELALLKNSYICHSNINQLSEKYKTVYAELIKKYVYLEGDRKEAWQRFTYYYDNLEKYVLNHNEEFVKKEKEECEKLLSDIGGKSLDNQQRTAVVTDEDHNLVVAGAGSGKTLTITGKVKYLCERKKISPNDILLIAFAKKAAEEMTERIQNMGIPLEAMTFHKLGLDIISHARDGRPVVLDETDFKQFMVDYFKNKILDDPLSMKALIEYFAYYLNIPSNMDKYESLGEAFEHERDSDFETLKSKYVIKKEGEFRANGRTLKGEYVKSREEIMIANFLFLHGIRYEYERLYPFVPTDEETRYRKPYAPDFYLLDYDIYLEHFGINEEGRVPWLSEIEEEKYLEGISWKRNLHREKGTKLIETYSYFNSKGILLEELEKRLKRANVRLIETDYQTLFKDIYDDTGERVFQEFIRLCSTFISLFNANGYTLEDLPKLQPKSREYKTPFFKERTKLFKAIIGPILTEYRKCLSESGKVDFSDMIIGATNLIRSGYQMHPYKYVIVDEFQDISVARYQLIKAILDQTGAHLLCVGDDWQSIFRFSGSDIGLFTEFSNAFGYSKIMRIEKTYRNSQELIDSASEFVMTNPKQMKKSLHSDKTCDTPISFYEYEQRENAGAAVIQAIDSILEKYGMSMSILILGRTTYDEEVLLETNLFMKQNRRGQEKLVYQKNKNADIQFLTVHRSKGLEADNVIILNFNNSKLGFPNKISDDPILELVLSTSDTFTYGEERRLLYVALTRTRNEVILITNHKNPSEFKREFDDDPNVREVLTSGTHLPNPIPCPRCRTGKLLLRTNAETHSSFVGCSNFPQCDYTVKDTSILTNPVKCEACGGFMVRRVGGRGPFLGCSNYPKCNNTMEICK